MWVFLLPYTRHTMLACTLDRWESYGEIYLCVYDQGPQQAEHVRNWIHCSTWNFYSRNNFTFIIRVRPCVPFHQPPSPPQKRDPFFERNQQQWIKKIGKRNVFRWPILNFCWVLISIGNFSLSLGPRTLVGGEISCQTLFPLSIVLAETFKCLNWLFMYGGWAVGIFFLFSSKLSSTSLQCWPPFHSNPPHFSSFPHRSTIRSPFCVS